MGDLIRFKRGSSAAVASHTPANGEPVYDKDRNIVKIGDGSSPWGDLEQLKAVPEGWVNVKDFGAKGDGVTDDTEAIQKAIDTGKNVYIPEGTYNVSQAIFINNQIYIKGNNATIRLLNKLDNPLLNFYDGVIIENLILDANNFNSNNMVNSYHGLIYINSEFSYLQNITIKNIKGLSDEFSYGIHISTKGTHTIKNSTFINITTQTDSSNTYGFCGGIFISNNKNNPTDIKHFNINIDNCYFEDIFTSPNNNNIVKPDSDAIRNYFFDYDLLPTNTKDIINQSKISILNSYSKNVLKSMAKLNYATVTIDNCSFIIDDLKYNDYVYCPFRYQYGQNFYANNLNISGDEIATGIISGASDNTKITNVNFETTGTNATIISLGMDDNIQLNSVTIENIFSKSASNGLYIRNVNKCILNNINLQNNNSLFLLTNNPNSIKIDNSTADNFIIKNYGTDEFTINNLYIENCNINSNDLYVINVNIDELHINSSKIFTTNYGLISYSKVFQKIHLSNLTIKHTGSSRLLDIRNVSSEVLLNNIEIEDLSNADISIYVYISNNVKLSNINFINATNTNSLIRIEGSHYSTITDLIVNNASTSQIIYNVNSFMIISNIHSFVSNSYITLYATATQAAIVSNFLGTLSSTPIQSTNFTVHQGNIISF